MSPRLHIREYPHPVVLSDLCLVELQQGQKILKNDSTAVRELVMFERYVSGQNRPLTCLYEVRWQDHADPRRICSYGLTDFSTACYLYQERYNGVASYLELA